MFIVYVCKGQPHSSLWVCLFGDFQHRWFSLRIPQFTKTQSGNVNPRLINPWLINRGVSPFSGDSSLLEGTARTGMGRVLLDPGSTLLYQIIRLCSFHFPLETHPGSLPSHSEAIHPYPLNWAQASKDSIRGLLFQHWKDAEQRLGEVDGCGSRTRARNETNIREPW